MNIENDPQLDLDFTPEPDRHWLRPFLLAALFCLMILICLLLRIPGNATTGEGGSAASGSGSSNQTTTGEGSGSGEQGDAAGKGSGKQQHTSTAPSPATPSTTTSHAGTAAEPSGNSSATAKGEEEELPPPFASIKRTPAEEEIYRRCCLYLQAGLIKNATADFPPSHHPEISIEDDRNSYRVKGFYFVNMATGRRIRYEYELRLQHETYFVMDSKTVRREK